MIKRMFMIIILICLTYTLLNCGSDEATKDENKSKKMTEMKPLNNKYHVMFKSGKTSNVIKECESALTKDPENPVLIYYIGLSQLRKGNLDQAKTMFNKLKEIGAKNNDLSASANAKRGLGKILLIKSDFPGARKITTEAMNEYYTIKDYLGLIHSYNQVGTTFFYEGHYLHAAKNFQYSLSFSNKVSQKEQLFDSYRFMGAIYYYTDKIDKAMEYYKRAKNLAEKDKNVENQAIILNQIGIIYREQDNYEDAAKTFTNALDKSKEIGNIKLIASILNNIGTLYLHGKKIEKAKKFLNKALVQCQKIKYKLGEAQALQNLAVAAELEKSYKTSIEYLNKSKEINEEIGYKRGLKDNYFQLARVYKLSGKTKNAKKFSQKNTDMRKVLVPNARRAFKVELNKDITPKDDEQKKDDKSASEEEKNYEMKL